MKSIRRTMTSGTVAICLLVSGGHSMAIDPEAARVARCATNWALFQQTITTNNLVTERFFQESLALDHC